MTSRYLDLPRRSREAVIAARILPGDRVRHPRFGPGRVGGIIADGAFIEAVLHCDDGALHFVAMQHLTKEDGK